MASPRRSSLGPLLALTVLGAATWLYFTPHLALRAMRQAADEHDAAALSDHVDFPALRASLKSTMSDRLAALAPQGILGALGMALAGTVADQAIDALVTPESLALILHGQKPPAAGGATAPPGDPPNPSVDAYYEGWDRYVVTLAPRSSPTLAVRLVLVRHGLATWLLSGVQLP